MNFADFTAVQASNTEYRERNEVATPLFSIRLPTQHLNLLMQPTAA